MKKRINNEIKGTNEELKKEKRERDLDLIFATGACVAGFSACYFLLNHFRK